MRTAGSFVALLALAAAGCESPGRVLALAPTPVVAAPPPGPPPAPPVPHPRLADANPMAVGETVRSQATTDDPLCDPGWPYRCRYFRIIAPRDGTLRVTMRWSAAQPDPYPLDIAVYGPMHEWESAPGRGAEREVLGPADSGASYLVEVWSFLTPAEPFELTSSIEPR